MIKFENTAVMNFENAIRGMRNPLDSWDKSDSGICSVKYCDEKCQYRFDHRPGCARFSPDDFIIGENDLALAQRLIKAGSDHRKFMRQIFVSVDITAPLYWWKEFDTYKVGTVANSCSTMHTLPKKEFTLDDFSHEHLTSGALDVLNSIIEHLNFCRKWFLSEENKSWWWQMIQLLPTSYNQRRTVTLNYENLRNIYGSRRNHKLDEWSVGFMEFIESLPYAKELIMI